MPTRRAFLLSALASTAAGLAASAQPATAGATTTSPVHTRRTSRYTTASVPPIAAGAGYTRRIFHDDFGSLASIDLTGAGMTGKKWSTKLPWGGTRTPADKLTVTSSGVSIDQAVANQNIALLTIDPSTGQGATFGYGYFEIRMRFDPSKAPSQGGFPALWLTPKSQMYHQVQPLPAGEIDIFEAYRDAANAYDGSFVGTVHDWTPVAGGNWQFTNQQNTNNVVPAGIDSAFHTYSVLWQPGRVRWYLDGKLEVDVAYGSDRLPSVRTIDWSTGATGSVGTFSILDEAPNQEMVLMMGTGPDWPMEVDWVSVWSA